MKMILNVLSQKKQKDNLSASMKKETAQLTPIEKAVRKKVLSECCKMKP